MTDGMNFAASDDYVETSDYALRNLMRTFVAIQWTILLVCSAFAVYAWTSYSNLKEEVAILRLNSARLRANIPVMQMAIDDNSEVVKQVSSSGAQLCSTGSETIYQTLPDRWKIALLNACGHLGAGQTQWTATLAFLEKYNIALSGRVNGTTSQDFAKDARLYRDAVELAFLKDSAGHYEVNQGWQIRALEGEGYAEMRAGRYAFAISRTQQAIDLAKTEASYPIYVFADLTHLKAECLSKTPSSAVVGQYAALKNGLSALASRFPADKSYHEIALNDLQTAANDAELFELCGYAHI